MRATLSLLAYLALTISHTAHAQTVVSIQPAAPRALAIAAPFPFTFTSITDQNSDGNGTIGEILQLHGTGLTANMQVFVGRQFNQKVSAPILFASPTRLDVAVPAGVETGTNGIIEIKLGVYSKAKLYPLQRRLAYVTADRTRAVVIANADTMTAIGSPIDFNAANVLDGDNAATAPLDVVINAAGNSAYVLLKKRIVLVDLIQGALVSPTGLTFSDGNATRALLSPLETYLATLSNSSPFLSTTSRIGPLPGNSTTTLAITLLNDAVITPDEANLYLIHGLNSISRLSLSPTYATQATQQPVPGSQQLSQIVLQSGSNTAFVGERVSNANDQIRAISVPNLTLQGSPLAVPGEIADLALTIPQGGQILVADCATQKVHRITISNGQAQTLPLADCPRSLELSGDGRFAYVERLGNGFTPPSYVSKWDLGAQMIALQLVESASQIRGSAVQP